MSPIGRNICDIISGADVGDHERQNRLGCNDHQRNKVKYEPVSHDHKAFLKNAQKREGFSKAYDDLAEEYDLDREM